MNGGGRRAFVVRFTELSITRIRNGRSSIDNEASDLEGIARELHSMAGEAGLLGMTEVMAFARAAEQATFALASSPGGERREAMIAALDDVETALRNATRGVAPDTTS